MQALTSAVDFFHYDVGRYPTSEEGLKALLSKPAGADQWDGPYLDKSGSVTDPWGNAYLYKMPGQHRAFDIFTLGSDDKPGGDGEAADVGNW